MHPTSVSWFRSGLIVSILSLGFGLSGCQNPSGDTESDSAIAEAEKSAAVDAEIAAARAAGKEANRQLDLDRQTLQLAAWQHVKAISGMWAELPPDLFPGLTTLVDQVETLREQIEQDSRILMGMIEPEKLTTQNPAYWRAVMETNPEDPVVDMFEQMLWMARGNFDRALWLIEIHRYGPALPSNVHKIIYSMADEMRRVRSQQSVRRNSLLKNVEPAEVAKVIATARSFQPGDPDWALMTIIVRLQMSGVPMGDLASRTETVDYLVGQMRDEWSIVARNNPMMGARLSPDRLQRESAESLADLLEDLSRSRGAFGGRDVVRLGEALAETGFYAEALLARQRATALRGFTVPSDTQIWWEWLPKLIGEEETDQLEADAMAGLIRPVTFFQTEQGPEGVSLLPLHPILTERNLRRLQEVQRRLEMPDLTDESKTSALITLAETLGHLGRWDKATEALAEVPVEFSAAAAPMRVWVSLWSGRVQGIEEHVAEIDELTLVSSPALPALAHASQGEWGKGAEVFLISARSEDVAKEYRTYYAMMASAFLRLAGDEKVADELIQEARALGEGLEWVSMLVRGMEGENLSSPVGSDVTEITEAGRVCEQRFYRAFQPDISPVLQRSLLEDCVSTGVVDFVEYTASLLRLRQLDPERWDPTQVPEAETADDDSENEENEDWTSDANPSWSIPS
ncbi:MAG: hypothetical protein QNK90_11990 [Opitutaceae bacterium]